MTTGLVSELRHKKMVGVGKQNPGGLSKRESEVLRLLAMGHTNQQIADKLFLSVRTVETYKARLKDKLGLQGRAELVRYAMRQGFLTTE